MAAFSPDKPLGLRQLIPLGKVLVRQKTTVTTGNKYIVTSPNGDIILSAKEDCGMWGAMLDGKSRAFNIDIVDSQDTEVIRLRRPYTFGPDKMDVTVCGQLVSIVRQETTFFKKVLTINDANDRQVLRIKGPSAVSGECEFKVLTTDKTRIGVIAKRWGGMLKEIVSDNDNFEIEFPTDMDVRFKAALIGTCFLIDFLYYES